MEFKQLANSHVTDSAKLLLGSRLVRTVNGKDIVCVITETEAYHETDEASHCYRGMTERNQSMYLDAGHLYVYLSYGIHFCMNIISGIKGSGEGALIRGGIVDGQAVSGPGRLTKAMQVTRELDGHYLANSPLKLELTPPVDPSRITATPRIGISKATDKLWRFVLNS